MRCWYSTSFTTPSTLEGIWQQALSNYSNLTFEQRNLLAKVCVGYLLHIYSVEQMKSLLEANLALTKSQGRELRQALINDFRTVLALKLVLVRTLAKQMLGMPVHLRRELRSANKSCLGVKLHMADRAVFYALADMGFLPMLHARITGLPINFIPTVGKVVAECGECFQRNYGFIARYVYSKLKFIYSSQGMQAQDLINDLIMKGVSTYYLHSPFKSRLHLENYAKRAVVNYGVTLIQKYNSQKKSRLIETEAGGFQNRVESADFIVGNPQIDKMSVENYKLALTEQARQDHQAAFRASLREYLPTANPLTGKVARLVAEDDREFIRFVRRTKRLRKKDITGEIIIRKYGRGEYIDLIAQYLHIPTDLVEATLTEIRGQIR